MQADYVMLGGGQPRSSRGYPRAPPRDNFCAIPGGIRLWEATILRVYRPFRGAATRAAGAAAASH
jgi:hypothetical protein